MSTDPDNIVEVPDTLCPLDDHNLTLLKQRVDFSIDDGNFGINVFIDTVTEVLRLLDVQRHTSLVTTG